MSSPPSSHPGLCVCRRNTFACQMCLYVSRGESRWVNTTGGIDSWSRCHWPCFLPHCPAPDYTTHGYRLCMQFAGACVHNLSEMKTTDAFVIISMAHFLLLALFFFVQSRYLHIGRSRILCRSHHDWSPHRVRVILESVSCIIRSRASWELLLICLI